MPKKDSPFDALTPRERKLVGLQPPEASSPADAIRRQAEGLTRGIDRKKLERDLKRLESPEWE